MSPRRRCGECTLCCKLLPMKKDKDREVRSTITAMVAGGMLKPEDAFRMTPDFDKPAGERCPHQRHSKGCAIYDRRPFGCRMWSCRWLVNDDTNALPRPDRSHYVIDIAPDFITDADTGTVIPVIQVWVDPAFPDAWHDDRLRDYIARRGKEGYATLIRYSGREAQAIFPPTMTGGGWVIKPRMIARDQEHTPEEKARALGTYKLTLG